MQHNCNKSWYIFRHEPEHYCISESPGWSGPVHRRDAASPGTQAESDIDFQREWKRSGETTYRIQRARVHCAVERTQPTCATPCRVGGWIHGQGRWNQPSVLSSCDPRSHPPGTRARLSFTVLWLTTSTSALVYLYRAARTTNVIPWHVVQSLLIDLFRALIFCVSAYKTHKKFYKFTR